MNDLLILNYHGLEQGPNEYSWEEVERPYALKVENFEAQLKILKHFRKPLSGTDDLQTWLTPKAMPRSSFLVTFDDGHKSHYDHALPILKRLDLKGLFFISAGLVGQPSMMDGSQLRELIEAGHEIGSHGYSHTALKDLSEEMLKHEIEGSKKILEEKLNTRVRSFSVPLGYANSRIKEAVIAAGYESMMTSEFDLNRVNDAEPYWLCRVALKKDIGLDEFKKWVHGKLGTKRISEKIKSRARQMLPAKIYDRFADVKRRIV